MPYSAVRKGNKVLIKRKDTGKVVGHSDSEEMAMKAMAARYMSEKSPEKMHNR